MTVFISHAFEDRAAFDNLAEALEQADVPYWNPTDIRLGKSLRDRLREAVGSCRVCIFIATQRSVESDWCHSELGAFWGLELPIIVYLADTSLTRDRLPEIVRGDVWADRILRVVLQAKELVKDAADAATDEVSRSARVAGLTVEQFEGLIVGVVSMINAAGKDDLERPIPQDVEDAARDAAGRLLRGIDATSHVTATPSDGWQRQILWVDDRPRRNQFERSTFKSIGIESTLAQSTQEALAILSRTRFAAIIISGLSGVDGPFGGYVALDAVRGQDNETPVFLYAGSRSPGWQREGVERGAQGATNSPAELFDMVVQALPEKPTD